MLLFLDVFYRRKRFLPYAGIPAGLPSAKISGQTCGQFLNISPWSSASITTGLSRLISFEMIFLDMSLSM